MLLEKLYKMPLPALLKLAGKARSRGERAVALCVYRARISAAKIAAGEALEWVGV